MSHTLRKPTDWICKGDSQVVQKYLACLQSDSVGFQPRQEDLRTGFCTFAPLHFAPLLSELRYQYYPHVVIDEI